MVGTQGRSRAEDLFSCTKPLCACLWPMQVISAANVIINKAYRTDNIQEHGRTMHEESNSAVAGESGDDSRLLRANLGIIR